MKYNCKTNCPLPRVNHNNIVVMDMIMRFGNMIFNGETISANGIQRAMEWSEIHRDNWWRVAQKVITYYSTVIHTRDRQRVMEAEKTKQGQKHAKK